MGTSIRRIITARLDSYFQESTIIQCYAPTNDAPDKVSRPDVSIVLGNMNAKVDEDNSGREEIWENMVWDQ